MRVVLVCVFGMSTYYVTKAVEKEAKARGLDLQLEAVPVSELSGKIASFDLVLVGPQVRFKQDEINKIAAAVGKKAIPIPPDMYSMTEAERLLDYILENKEEG